MKINRVLASLFLTVLLVSTFFALSANVLEIKFCAFPITHHGRLCDILRSLNHHNFFASALAGIIIFIALVLLRAGQRPSSQITSEWQFLTAAKTAVPHYKFSAWLKKFLNSPNFSPAFA